MAIKVDIPRTPDFSPAHTDASRLWQIATGYWASKALFSAVEIGLFDEIAKFGTLTRAELSSRLGLAERPADLLLTACASLGLLDVDNGEYRNSRQSQEFLTSQGEHYLGEILLLQSRRGYPAWNNLVSALTSDLPMTPSEEGGRLYEGEHQLFWRAMDAVSKLSANSLAARLQLGDRRRLLDIGGGLGTFSISLCESNPELNALVFDLPEVCGTATEFLAARGWTQRIKTRPGNFLDGSPWPSGHDIALLSQILHNWDEKTCRHLLDKCYSALDSNGLVVICELMVDDDKSGPATAALMSLHMLVETDAGRNYTVADYRSWLTDVGFEDVQILRLDGICADGALVARKPG